MARQISAHVPKVAPGGFVVIDTETTGLHDPARVIEIALVFTDRAGNVERSWTTLVKGDGTSGGSRVRAIHGIHDHQLHEAPTFATIAPAVSHALKDRIVIGHNAKFDRARLNYELRLLRKPELPELACTMYLGIYLGYGQLRLDDAIQQFGIKRTTAHCAEDDALATAELLRYYLTRHTATVDEYLRKKGLRRQ